MGREISRFLFPTARRRRNARVSWLLVLRETNFVPKLITQYHRPPSFKVIITKKCLPTCPPPSPRPIGRPWPLQELNSGRPVQKRTIHVLTRSDASLTVFTIGRLSRVNDQQASPLCTNSIMRVSQSKTKKSP